MGFIGDITLSVTMAANNKRPVVDADSIRALLQDSPSQQAEDLAEKHDEKASAQSLLPAGAGGDEQADVLVQKAIPWAPDHRYTGSARIVLAPAVQKSLRKMQDFSIEQVIMLPDVEEYAYQPETERGQGQTLGNWRDLGESPVWFYITYMLQPTPFFRQTVFFVLRQLHQHGFVDADLLQLLGEYHPYRNSDEEWEAYEWSMDEMHGGQYSAMAETLVHLRIAAYYYTTMVRGTLGRARSGEDVTQTGVGEELTAHNPALCRKMAEIGVSCRICTPKVLDAAMEIMGAPRDVLGTGADLYAKVLETTGAQSFSAESPEDDVSNFVPIGFDCHLPANMVEQTALGRSKANTGSFAYHMTQGHQYLTTLCSIAADTTAPDDWNATLMSLGNTPLKSADDLQTLRWWQRLRALRLAAPLRNTEPAPAHGRHHLTANIPLLIWTGKPGTVVGPKRLISGCIWNDLPTYEPIGGHSITMSVDMPLGIDVGGDMVPGYDKTKTEVGLVHLKGKDMAGYYSWWAPNTLPREEARFGADPFAFDEQYRIPKLYNYIMGLRTSSLLGMVYKLLEPEGDPPWEHTAFQNRASFNTWFMQHSHFSPSYMKWHAMGRADYTILQQRDAIVEQCLKRFREGVENFDLLSLGSLLHTVEDSYCMSHCKRRTPDFAAPDRPYDVDKEPRVWDRQYDADSSLAITNFELPETQDKDRHAMMDRASEMMRRWQAQKVVVSQGARIIRMFTECCVELWGPEEVQLSYDKQMTDTTDYDHAEGPKEKEGRVVVEREKLAKGWGRWFGGGVTSAEFKTKGDALVAAEKPIVDRVIAHYVDILRAYLTGTVFKLDPSVNEDKKCYGTRYYKKDDTSVPPVHSDVSILVNMDRFRRYFEKLSDIMDAEEMPPYSLERDAEKRAASLKELGFGPAPWLLDYQEEPLIKLMDKLRNGNVSEEDEETSMEVLYAAAVVDSLWRRATFLTERYLSMAMLKRYRLIKRREELESEDPETIGFAYKLARLRDDENAAETAFPMLSAEQVTAVDHVMSQIDAIGKATEELLQVAIKVESAMDLDQKERDPQLFAAMRAALNNALRAGQPREAVDAGVPELTGFESMSLRDLLPAPTDTNVFKRLDRASLIHVVTAAQEELFKDRFVRERWYRANGALWWSIKQLHEQRRSRRPKVINLAVLQSKNKKITREALVEIRHHVDDLGIFVDDMVRRVKSGDVGWEVKAFGERHSQRTR